MDYLVVPQSTKKKLSSQLIKHFKGDDVDSLRKEFDNSESLVLQALTKELLNMLTDSINSTQKTTEGMWQAQGEQRVLRQTLLMLPNLPNVNGE